MKRFLLLLKKVFLLCGGMVLSWNVVAQVVVNQGTVVTINSKGAAAGFSDLRYEWTMSKNGATATIVAGATDSAYATPSTLEPGTYVYRRWACSDACNSRLGTDGFTIVIKNCSATTPPVPDSIGGFFCDGGSATIGATIPGYYTREAVIDWYADNNPNSTALLHGNNSYYTPPLTGSTTRYYYAEARDVETGCVSYQRKPVAAKPYAMPAVPIAGNIDIAKACYGGPARMEATQLPANANTCRWYSVSSGGTLLMQGATFVTPNMTAATNYYVSGYNTTTGCESATRLTVKPGVNASVGQPTITKNESICLGGVATLMATAGTNGDICRWYATADAVEMLAQNNTCVTPPVETPKFYVTSYNATTGCESTRKEVAISVSTNKPTADLRWVPAGGKATLLVKAKNGEAPYLYAFGSSASGSSAPNVFAQMPVTTPSNSISIITTPNTAQTSYTGIPVVYVKVKDNKGCVSNVITSTTTTTIPKIPNNTYCANCGLEEGIAPVDVWVKRVSGPLLINNNLISGAMYSLTDGRANTKRLLALSNRSTGITNCADADLASGWYIAAYGEVRTNGNAYTTAMGVTGADLYNTTCSTVANGAKSWPAGIIWNPGEPNNSNGTSESCINGNASSNWMTGSANDVRCYNTITGSVCVWRPWNQ